MRQSDNIVKDFFLQQAELFTDEFYFEERKEKPPVTDSIPLSDLKSVVLNCQKCALAETRTKVVFGSGRDDADLLFIGEAPGEQEDLTGEPFVGRAGQLLDRILAAIQLQRADVYIANILKCRPPNNRTPRTDEIEKCEPYLMKQIDSIRPSLIICLGLTAAKTLLRVESALKDMRGKIYNYHDVDLMVTYHPAALLRNPNLKKYAWEDFQKIQKIYKQKTGSL